MTTTPSGQRRSARARWVSVSVVAVRTSYSSSTRLSEVLTDWPPGPGEREKRSTRSASGTTSPDGRPGPGRDVQVLHAPRLRHSMAGQVSMTIADPGRGRAVEGRLVDDAELEPHALRADGDRLVGELAGRLGAAEHVDDVDRERDVGQRGVALLAEHGRRVRVDRHDPLAAPLEQGRDGVRRAAGVTGQAHDRPGLEVVEHPVDGRRVLPVRLMAPR